jgi:hypothetical protein
MYLQTINKIALGKKPLEFLSYEAIVESQNNVSKLVSINILAGSKILTKIKANTILSLYEENQLDKLVFDIITSFIAQAEDHLSGSQTQHNAKPFKPTKKQKEARAEAASSLFDHFNL